MTSQEKPNNLLPPTEMSQENLGSERIIANLGSLTTKGNWLGGISAANMIAEDFTTQEQIDHAIGAIDNFFVPENTQAETRCIDGRCNSTMSADNLGAQVPGGTPGAALAYRLAGINDSFEVGTFVDDAHTMLVRTLELGFTPGDHRDTHGHGVGCGAIDKMDAAFSAMLSPELIDDHKQLVSKLLGDSFSESVYMQILGAGVVLHGRIDEYLLDREKSIEEIEQTIQRSVAVLEGDHHECLMVVNTVLNTTFDTKAFSESYNGMQAFNYDFWRTLELADKLLPNDEDKKSRFVMARTMTAVATLMVLTDGTQNLLVRSEV